VVAVAALTMLAEPIERVAEARSAETKGLHASSPRVAEVSELIQYPRRSRWRRLIRWWRRLIG
jgi:hypothetical protein